MAAKARVYSRRLASLNECRTLRHGHLLAIDGEGDIGAPRCRRGECALDCRNAKRQRKWVIWLEKIARSPYSAFVCLELDLPGVRSTRER